MPLDPAALEQQLAILRPLEARLRSEAWRRPLDPVDWRGPAADAARDLEARMLAHVRDAAAAADDAVRRITAARSALP